MRVLTLARMTADHVLVLASASPARLGLLRQAGLDPGSSSAAWTRTPSTAATPAELALVLAEAKAAAVAGPGWAVRRAGHRLRLGARPRTAEALGKPRDADDAMARWKAMRGRAGVLHTGHCVIDTATGEPRRRPPRRPSASARRTTRRSRRTWRAANRFRWRARSPSTAARRPFVDGIEGDPANVIGLSLPLLRAPAGRARRPDHRPLGGRRPVRGGRRRIGRRVRPPARAEDDHHGGERGPADHPDHGRAEHAVHHRADDQHQARQTAGARSRSAVRAASRRTPAGRARTRRRPPRHRWTSRRRSRPPSDMFCRLHRPCPGRRFDEADARTPRRPARRAAVAAIGLRTATPCTRTSDGRPRRYHAVIHRTEGDTSDLVHGGANFRARQSWGSHKEIGR